MICQQCDGQKKEGYTCSFCGGSGYENALADYCPECRNTGRTYDSMHGTTYHCSRCGRCDTDTPIEPQEAECGALDAPVVDNTPGLEKCVESPSGGILKHGDWTAYKTWPDKEWVVAEGNRVVARFGTSEQAERDAKEMLQNRAEIEKLKTAIWDLDPLPHMNRVMTWGPYGYFATSEDMQKAERAVASAVSVIVRDIQSLTRGAS